MPPRSAEEKERRRKLREEKLAAKKAAKLAKEEEEKKKKDSKAAATATNNDNESSNEGPSGPCPFVELPEDAIRQLFCFLPSRELGATIMTCSTLNRYMGESRVMHLLSRLNRPNRPYHRDDDDEEGQFDGDSRCAIKLCDNEADIRVSRFRVYRQTFHFTKKIM